jgi:hypothetical protein
MILYYCLIINNLFFKLQSMTMGGIRIFCREEGTAKTHQDYYHLKNWIFHVYLVVCIGISDYGFWVIYTHVVSNCWKIHISSEHYYHFRFFFITEEILPCWCSFFDSYHNQPIFNIS